MAEEVTPTDKNVETEDLDIEETPGEGETEKITPTDEGGESEELSAEELQKQLKDEREQREKAEARGGYWEREAKRQQDKTTEPKPDEKPSETARPKPEASQYESYDEFNEALMDWKLDQKEAGVKAAEAKTNQQERDLKFQERMNKGFEKHEDFEKVVRNPNVPINENIVNALFDCEHAADIAYHLGQNPQEARRIASLSPIATAREIGKLEARFSGPPQKTTTKAPDATQPVGSKEAIPKKYEDMTADDTEDFIAQRNKEEFGSP